MENLINAGDEHWYKKNCGIEERKKDCRKRYQEERERKLFRDVQNLMFIPTH